MYGWHKYIQMFYGKFLNEITFGQHNHAFIDMYLKNKKHQNKTKNAHKKTVIYPAIGHLLTKSLALRVKGEGHNCTLKRLLGHYVGCT